MLGSPVPRSIQNRIRMFEKLTTASSTDENLDPSSEQESSMNNSNSIKMTRQQLNLKQPDNKTTLDEGPPRAQDSSLILRDVTNHSRASRRETLKLESLRTTSSSIANIKKRPLSEDLLQSGISLRKKLKPSNSNHQVANASDDDYNSERHRSLRALVDQRNGTIVTPDQRSYATDTQGQRAEEACSSIHESNISLNEKNNNSLPDSDNLFCDESMNSSSRTKPTQKATCPSSVAPHDKTPPIKQRKLSKAFGTTSNKQLSIERESLTKFKRTVSKKIISLQNSLLSETTSSIAISKTAVASTSNSVNVTDTVSYCKDSLVSEKVPIKSDIQNVNLYAETFLAQDYVHSPSSSVYFARDSPKNAKKKLEEKSPLENKKNESFHLSQVKKEGKESLLLKTSSVPGPPGTITNSRNAHTKPQPNLMLSCSEEEVERVRKSRRRRSFRWRRFWEILYAALAILELNTCSQMTPLSSSSTTINNKLDKLEVCSAREPPPFSATNAITQRASCETANTLGEHKIRRRLQEQQTSTEQDKNKRMQEQKTSARQDKNRRKQEQKKTTQQASFVSFFSQFKYYNPLFQTSWQDWINKAFIIAVIIHISLESWSIASLNNEKKQKEEKAKAKRTLVTGRSSRRRTALDESSYNRHVIRKWSKNRIRWTRATTDIAKAAVFFAVLQLFALPVLRNSPFRVEKTKKELIKLFPRLLPKLKKLSQGVAATNTTLSIGEVIILHVSSWLQSRAMKTLKRALFKSVKAVIFRPKKINTIFTWIRWTKFVAPLLGKTNKLRGNLMDLVQKSRQRRQRKQVVLRGTSKSTIQAICRMQAKFRVRRASRRRAHPQDQDTFEIFSSNRSRRWKKERSVKIGRKKLKLLLRPNTAFSVGWKAITVSCVFTEILSNLLLAPELSTKVNVVDNLLKILLAPSVAYIVRLVSFFDVFLSFFTGELDKTGQLVPKPFFKRYILPGLGLQLLVNPTLKDISKVVLVFLQWSMRIGPSRMLHIVLALQPLIRGILHLSIDFLFFFVTAWNHGLPKKKKMY